MFKSILPVIFAVISVFCEEENYDDDISTYPFLMPKVRPFTDELYLCHRMQITHDANYYIVGFEPNATMNTAHHMVIYGCSEPASGENVWQCGVTQNGISSDISYTPNACGQGSQIVYAWARDAPTLTLPEGVGFLVGKDSPIKHLVLQVHYSHAFPRDKLDDSGVFIKYTERRMPRQAGVILLATGGSVAPLEEVHMETACTLDEDKTIHPFAFRTHTHSLGKMVSGYVVRRTEMGDQWSLLGRMDPQKPQMFYPTVINTPIKKGDVLAARCTMNNTRGVTVYTGPTNEDEMCDYYIMYWVENDTPLSQKYCFSPGPPHYYWSNAPERFNAIPEIEASLP